VAPNTHSCDSPIGKDRSEKLLPAATDDAGIGPVWMHLILLKASPLVFSDWCICLVDWPLADQVIADFQAGQFGHLARLFQELDG
jgi:hypothetical protein